MHAPTPRCAQSFSFFFQARASSRRKPGFDVVSLFSLGRCCLSLQCLPVVGSCDNLRWQDSGWRVQESDVAGRRDLRKERAISVDPPGCQDIDDAMHVKRKPNGKLEVRNEGGNV